MNWKYYIPHVWNSPEDRTLWEDVWLLAEDGSNGGKPYWFTLNALSFMADGIEGKYPDDPDDPDDPLGGLGGSKLVREMNLQLLGDRDYFITPALDMVARVEDFNMHELLGWTRLLIRVHLGDPDPELVKGDFEDFTGTNSHVSEIGRITEALAAGIPEDEIINYRTGDAGKKERLTPPSQLTTKPNSTPANHCCSHATHLNSSTQSNSRVLSALSAKSRVHRPTPLLARRSH